MSGSRTTVTLNFNIFLISIFRNCLGLVPHYFPPYCIGSTHILLRPNYYQWPWKGPTFLGNTINFRPSYFYRAFSWTIQTIKEEDIVLSVTYSNLKEVITALHATDVSWIWITIVLGLTTALVSIIENSSCSCYSTPF